MRLCFDTNVVLDLLVRASDFPESYFVFDIANIRKFDLFLSANSITDTAFLLHRLGQKNAVIKGTLEQLFELCEILDVTKTDCINAINSNTRDFEDAVLVATSQRNNIDMIITRNKRDFKTSPVPTITPKDFVRQFCPSNYEYDVICS